MPAASPVVIPPAPISSLPLLGHRRPDEREVGVNSLLVELGTVGSVDGGLGLLKGFVLDEGVALWGGEGVRKAMMNARDVASSSTDS